MANNKVQLSDGTTLMDLTQDTVTPQTLLSGATAHNAAGEQIVGEATSGGMTQEEADARYLQLSGGTMTGALHVKDGDSNDEPATVKQLSNFVSKFVPVMTNLVLLVSGWTSSNDLYMQTVTFEPISGDSTSQAVFVSPSPSYISPWVDSNIRCVGAVDGGLVFACDTVPGKDIYVNVTVFPKVSYVEGE